MLTGQVLLNELETARERVNLLERLYALETGDTVPQSMTITSPPSPSILKQIAHAPAPRVQVTPREAKAGNSRTCTQCKQEKDGRAFRGGGDVCTVCQRASGNGGLKLSALKESKPKEHEAAPGAYWRQCVKCKRKLGARKFWGKGETCRECDPEGKTQTQSES